MTRNFPFTIRQVAGILNIKVRYDHTDSGNMGTDCPFCKKKSKLNLNASKNVYRCNNCGEYGGMIELYGKVHAISNADAYREICEILGCGTNPVNNSTSNPEQPDPAKPKGRADNETIHQAYSMLLSMLTLAAPHREQLLAKGLPQEHIEKFGYKSVPAFGQQALCLKLLQSESMLLTAR